MVIRGEGTPADLEIKVGRFGKKLTPSGKQFAGCTKGLQFCEKNIGGFMFNMVWLAWRGNVLRMPS